MQTKQEWCEKPNDTRDSVKNPSDNEPTHAFGQLGHGQLPGEALHPAPDPGILEVLLLQRLEPDEVVGRLLLQVVPGRSKAAKSVSGARL